MAWDDLRGYVDQVAYLAYLSGMPGGECLVVCQAGREERRRVCSTYLAWGDRRNLASKLLSYFFTTILSQMLGQDGGCLAGLSGRVTAHLHGSRGLSFLVTSRCTS